MKRIIFVGKIEKGKLVKYKADFGEFIKAQMEMIRPKKPMKFVEIDVDVSFGPEVGANVPGVHS